MYIVVASRILGGVSLTGSSKSNINHNFLFVSVYVYCLP